MFRPPVSSRTGLSAALGLLLVCASAPAWAGVEDWNEEAPRFRSFELIPSDRASELPSELRASDDANSIAESLGLSATAGGHTVRLHWVVREHENLAGYRVTLVSADGIPGHLAARWWVQPDEGRSIGDGLIAYSAEIALAFAGQEPVAAAIEAVDASGNAVLLGVRRSIAQADPEPQGTLSARSEATFRAATVLQANRLAPAAPATPVAATDDFRAGGAPLGARSAEFVPGAPSSEAASPRGPPTAGITT